MFCIKSAHMRLIWLLGVYKIKHEIKMYKDIRLCVSGQERQDAQCVIYRKRKVPDFNHLYLGNHSTCRFFSNLHICDCLRKPSLMTHLALREKPI